MLCIHRQYVLTWIMASLTTTPAHKSHFYRPILLNTFFVTFRTQFINSLENWAELICAKHEWNLLEIFLTRPKGKSTENSVHLISIIDGRNRLREGGRERKETKINCNRLMLHMLFLILGPFVQILNAIKFTHKWFFNFWICFSIDSNKDVYFFQFVDQK